MRAALLLIVPIVAACGRFGFVDQAEDGEPSSLDIIAVRPVWVMPAGGRIEIDFAIRVESDGDSLPAELSVTIDGAPCGNVIIGDGTLSCDAPPRAPGVVELVVSDGDLATASWDEGFVYVTPGAYQLGGASNDRTSGIAVDRRGNVYVSGGTDGALDGANAGGFDSILVKYDAAGRLAWVRQLGGAGFDYARDVVIDPVTDSPTIVGWTSNVLPGETAMGNNDIFVARYSPDGDLTWVTQTGSAGDDQSWDLGVDSTGSVVVAMRTTGALAAPNAGLYDYGVIRYAPDGSVAWMRQLGAASDDQGHSIAVAADGTSYLVGFTDGALGGTNAGGFDLFVAKFAPDGTPGWIRQRGTPDEDRANDATIAADGSLWVAGRTSGALDGNTNAGTADIFAMQFGADGTWRQTRQFGSTAGDDTYGIGVSPSGDVFVTCNAGAGFGGAVAIGGGDTCMISFAADGSRMWTRIVGTTSGDSASSVAVDSYTGLVYMSAITSGGLDGATSGGLDDIAVVKVDATGAVR